MTTYNSLTAGAVAVGRRLAIGVSAGWWTLEALDIPPNPTDWKLVPYRNLAREWIAAHPDEWRVLQERAYSDDTLARPPWLA